MRTQTGEPELMQLPFVQLHELCADGGRQRWQLSLSDAGEDDAGAGRRLLVLLDGNLTAIPAALMMQSRMERGLGHFAPCTVVGVGYPGARFYDRERRARDFLPALPAGVADRGAQGGQADAFSQFLDARLLPWLEARNGGPFSAVGLFGHSFGGLFALYKLLNHPGRFDAFFSISPSLWWADGWLLGQLGSAAERCSGRTLGLGIGADERAMPGDDAQRLALHHERDLQGRFAQLLGALHAQAVPVQVDIYAGEDHGSVVYPAITRAIRWLMQPQTQDNTHAIGPISL